MKKFGRKTFTLNLESIELLENFKTKYKVNNSVIVRALLNHYLDKKEELYEILIGDE